PGRSSPLSVPPADHVLPPGLRSRAVTVSSWRSSCDIHNCWAARAVAVVINSAARATSPVTLKTSCRPSVPRLSVTARGNGYGVRGGPPAWVRSGLALLGVGLYG